MAGQRGEVVNATAEAWVLGNLPTAEYWARVYAEERERAAEQVQRQLLERRTRVSASAKPQSGL